MRLERSATEGQQAASSALRRARQARQDVKARAPEVKAAAARLREANRRNHFAESIRASFEGAGP